MSLKKTEILKISITTESKERILEYIKKYLVSRSSFTVKQGKNKSKPLNIVTPNPEQIVYAQKDKHFANILNRADVAIPDGIGIVLAHRFLHSQLTTHHSSLPLRRIPGIDLMEDLVKMGAERGDRIALIGGRRGVAVEALECLQQKYPNLAGWAQDGPEFEMKNEKLKMKNGKQNQDIYFEQLARRIRENNTKIVFVGLGAPKQEYFMRLLATRYQLLARKQKKKIASNQSPVASSLILMSVGGSFDILAGRTPRASLVVRSLGLEWLWRLIREPWRFRRQLALVEFVRLVLWTKIRSITR